MPYWKLIDHRRLLHIPTQRRYCIHMLIKYSGDFIDMPDLFTNYLFRNYGKYKYLLNSSHFFGQFTRNFQNAGTIKKYSKTCEKNGHSKIEKN